jgi:hypothetical protein
MCHLYHVEAGFTVRFYSRTYGSFTLDNPFPVLHTYCAGTVLVVRSTVKYSGHESWPFCPPATTSPAHFAKAVGSCAPVKGRPNLWVGRYNIGYSSFNFSQPGLSCEVRLLPERQTWPIPSRSKLALFSELGSLRLAFERMPDARLLGSEA